MTIRNPVGKVGMTVNHTIEDINERDAFIEDITKLMNDYKIEQSKLNGILEWVSNYRICHLPKTKIYPDWNSAPKWANYWVRHDNGRMSWAENKPTKLQHGYVIENGRGRECFLEDWQESLQERPNEY